MSNNFLDEILEAEKKAAAVIDEANKQAQSIIDKAKADAKISSNSILSDYKTQYGSLKAEADKETEEGLKKSKAAFAKQAEDVNAWAAKQTKAVELIIGRINAKYGNS